MLFSYDYQDILEELKADIIEFNISPDDDLYIVRGEITFNEYRPIIDYYLSVQDVCDEDKIVIVLKIKAKDVINEMEKMNNFLGGSID